MNWFQRHLNWTLLIGVIGGPVLFFWIVFGLVNLVALFAPKIAALIFTFVVSSMSVMFIVIIILVVRWYLGKRRHNL